MLSASAGASIDRNPYLPGRLIRGTQWFGILTYAVYVIHEPIFIAIRQRIPRDLSEVQSIEFTAIAIAITIIVAAIAYWLIERPFDAMRRKARPAHGPG